MNQTSLKNKGGWLDVFFAATIVLLFFGGNWAIRFTVDTYAILTSLKREAAMAFHLNGRFFTALLYTIFRISGMRTQTMFYISYGLGLLFLTGSLFLLTCILKKYFCWTAAAILSTTLLCCPAVLEYFLYFETASFLFSMFSVVLAFAFVLQFFHTQNKKHLGYALLSLFPSIFSYQGITPGFIVLCLPFLIYHCGKRFSVFLKNNLLAAVLYAIPNAVLYGYLHIFSQENRAQSIYSSLREALYYAAYHTKEIWMGMFRVIVIPSFGSVYLKYRIHILLTLLLIALSAAAAIYQWLADRNIGALAVRLFSVGYVLTGCAALQFVFMLMADVSLRLSLPLSMVNGSLAVNLFLNILDKRRNTSVWAIICLCLVGLQCIGTGIGSQMVFQEQYQVNALDRAEALAICDAIAEQEQVSGTEITKISFYFPNSDLTPYPSYFDLFGLSRAMSIDWSDAAHISYYLGRNLEKQGNDESVAEQFAQIDPPANASSQILFTGNTVHICVY